MQKKKFNAGVIGLGVGRRHLDVYLKHPAINKVSACDFNPDKINSLSTHYNDVKFYNSFNDIIEDPNIDIVSITSYDNYHCEHIIKAIKNNKHIFIEKPICINENELINIFDTYKKNSLQKYLQTLF